MYHLKMVYANTYISLVNNTDIKKDELMNLSGVKSYID